MQLEARERILESLEVVETLLRLVRPTLFLRRQLISGRCKLFRHNVA